MAPKRTLDSPEPEERPARRLPHPEPPPSRTTEEFIEPPVTIENQTCDCGDSCTTGGSCSCQKWGAACKASCACHKAASENCANALNHWLPLYFGENGNKLRATACFKKYLLVGGQTSKGKKKKRDTRQILPEQVEKLLLKEIEGYADIDETMQDWFKAFQKMSPTSPDRPAHIQKLFRSALSDYGSFYFKYSFCNMAWEQTDMWIHCWNCDECEPDKETWHCSVCNKCRAFLMNKCEGCGGVSSTVEMLKEMREKGEQTCGCAWHSGPLPC